MWHKNDTIGLIYDVIGLIYDVIGLTYDVIGLTYDVIGLSHDIIRQNCVVIHNEIVSWKKLIKQPDNSKIQFSLPCENQRKFHYSKFVKTRSRIIQ